MLHTQINGTIVDFSKNWNFKAHIDFREGVPLNAHSSFTMKFYKESDSFSKPEVTMVPINLNTTASQRRSTVLNYK